jgi:phosphohistidine phosphatase SixA
MKLIFFRHAEAQKKHPDDTELDDYRRELVKIGIVHARAMVKACAFLWKGNQGIFTSSYPRAVQTAEILQRKIPRSFFEMTTALDKFSDPQEVIKLIRGLEDGTYTFVGHEPQFSRLLGLLVTGKALPIVTPPKAGIVVLEGESLRNLRIQSIFTPKLILKF